MPEVQRRLLLQKKCTSEKIFGPPLSGSLLGRGGDSPRMRSECRTLTRCQYPRRHDFVIRDGEGCFFFCPSWHKDRWLIARRARRVLRSEWSVVVQEGQR